MKPAIAYLEKTAEQLRANIAVFDDRANRAIHEKLSARGNGEREREKQMSAYLDHLSQSRREAQLLLVDIVEVLDELKK